MFERAKAAISPFSPVDKKKTIISLAKVLKHAGSRRLSASRSSSTLLLAAMRARPSLPRFFLGKTLVLFSSPTASQSLSSFSTSAVTAAERVHKPNEAAILDTANEFSIIPAATLVGLRSTKKPLSVVRFFKSCGLSDAQIARLITRHPRVLFCNVDKVLAPKFQLLQNLGMSGVEVACILRKTGLLERKLDTHLAPRIEFLRSILRSDGDVVQVCKKSVWSLTASNEICKRMLSAISIFKELGFADDDIRKHVVRDPRLFQLKPELIRQAISRVDTELGVEYKSGYMYFYAVATLCQLDTPLAVASKFQIFKDYGWSMGDITTLVRCQPTCLLCKKEKLVMGLEFLMRTAGLSPTYVAKRPTLLMMSIESRIIPRFNAFSALRSKNLISEKKGFYTAACMSEESFVKKYILNFELEAPDVYKTYLNRMELAKKK